MTKIFRSTVLVAGLVTLIMTVSAAAQTAYITNVPFDFTVGKKSYKAGTYSVGLLFSFTDSRKVALRDRTGRNAYMFIPMTETVRVDRATLVFASAAGRYRLTAITTPSFSVRVPKSNSKVVLADNTSDKTETIVMTAGK